MKQIRSPVKTRLLICLLLLGLKLATPELADARKGSKLHIPDPQIGSEMDAADRFAFTAAFGLAVKKLHERDSCRALFDGLYLDGLTALVVSRYDPARSAIDLLHCRGKVVALTGLGRGNTRICAYFRYLSRKEQAATLIHEALHTAGLSESPPDPEALTVREINTMVKTACGF